MNKKLYNSKRIIILKWILVTITIWSLPAQNQTEEALYKEYCSVCHGDEGRGDGFAAKFLDPKPRDFTSGKYKIRSTISLPTDDDINRVITRGIPGTLMPAFKQDLDEQEINSLVAHVKELDITNAFKGKTPTAISFPEPPPETDELLTMGETLYVDNCVACHGSYGQGDGLRSNSLIDDWKDPIRPYDLTGPADRMKGGSNVEEIYQTIYVGMGAAMPAFEKGLSPDQYWALAYYVLSLAESDEDSDDWGEESSETVEGDSDIGKDLVMGVKPFENGGPPCMGCHSVMGEKAITSGGGPWGPDLTIAHQKFKEYGLSIFLETIPFPTMGPLYHPRPLTEEERGHVLAFLISMQQ
ncbi:MAG: c-type cytochrome, partial [Candidatus Marinimicrobia bacterium]|nr:c-type cytochrome [Candidatus Neomarinimicrobiota bacterium]